MGESGWLIFLRNTSIICNGIGLVIALAFLLGPKALLAVSKFLDTYRSSGNLEKVLETRSRIILGITLLIITTLMLGLAINIPV